MKRLLALLAALLALASGYCAEEKTAPAITVEELAAPSGAAALGASFATASDGRVCLSWLEPLSLDRVGSNAHALRFAVLETVKKKWGAPVTITKDNGLFTWFYMVADYPSLTVGSDGHATAAFYWHNAAHNIEHRAAITQTEDGGKTWSAPRDLAATLDSESVVLTTLSDGRVLAVWLDGRDSKTDIAQKLFARVLGGPEPDILIDKSVVNFSQLSLTAFPDGSALLAYHGRSDDNLTTVRTARFRGKAWDDSRPLDNDIVRATGPHLASDGGRVAAAWFSAADNEPRVLASFSPDAGARFLQPLRVDHGKPAGPVDTAILHDGALVVTWGETDGSVWLSRVTPDFTADPPVRLAPPGAPIPNAPPWVAHPRIALLHDYAGGNTSAQLVVAFASNRSAPLRTLLVTVPEGDLLVAGKNCDCAPTAEQLQGFPLRGTIAAVDAARGMVRVKSEESPGVLAAGMHEFSAAPDVIAAVSAGRQFLGRIERHDGGWRLFDVRLFVAK